MTCSCSAGAAERMLCWAYAADFEVDIIFLPFSSSYVDNMSHENIYRVRRDACSGRAAEQLSELLRVGYARHKDRVLWCPWPVRG